MQISEVLATSAAVAIVVFLLAAFWLLFLSQPIHRAINARRNRQYHNEIWDKWGKIQASMLKMGTKHEKKSENLSKKTEDELF